MYALIWPVESTFLCPTDCTPRVSDDKTHADIPPGAGKATSGGCAEQAFQTSEFRA